MNTHAPHPDVVNEALLLARLGANAALAASLLRDFVAMHGEDGVQPIETAVVEGRLADAFHLTHQLAGTSGNLGLERLAATAKRAEGVLSAALKAPAPAASRLSALDLDAVEHALCEALVGCRLTAGRLEAGSCAVTEGGALGTGMVDALRRRLLEEVCDNRLEALDTLEEAAPYLGPELADLRGALARLDFTTAAVILKGQAEE